MNIKLYRTIILPVFCGWETGSLTLREEHRLRMLGPKRDKVRGSGEHYTKEKLYDLY